MGAYKERAWVQWAHKGRAWVQWGHIREEPGYSGHMREEPGVWIGVCPDGQWPEHSRYADAVVGCEAWDQGCRSSFYVQVVVGS